MVGNRFSTSAWFSSGAPGKSSSVRLYAVPQAGGGAASVTHLGRALGTRIPTRAIRLPFRESRLTDPLPDSLHSLADNLAEVLAIHAGGEEFLLLGHCSGALLAYETAVRLAGHVGLRGLVVSAQVAPERFNPAPTRAMSAGEFQAHVEEHRLVPPEVLAVPALWELLEPTLRADLRLCEMYRPSAHVLDVPVLVVHGRHDARFHPADAAAWSTRTSAASRLITLDRDHDYLGSRPEDLAGALVDSLPLFVATESCD